MWILIAAIAVIVAAVAVLVVIDTRDTYKEIDELAKEVNDIIKMDGGTDDEKNGG